MYWKTTVEQSCLVAKTMRTFSVKLVVFIVFIGISVMSDSEEKFDLDVYVSAAMDGSRLQTESHDRTWGIGKADSWNVDMVEEKIWWLFSDGKKASAFVQIIGTYNPSTQEFLWGWDHPSVKPPLDEHALKVNEFGKKYSIQKYTAKMVKASEDEAWEFVAVANRLSNANGGYRGDAGGPIVFMTFGEIKLEQEKP